MKKSAGALALIALLAGCQSTPSADPPRLFEEFRGDPGVARTAVGHWVEKGTAAIPELKIGLTDDSVKVQRYSTEALARITGQWGWQDGLLWKRSVAEANGLERPLMVLHLFGKFDEEFC